MTASGRHEKPKENDYIRFGSHLKHAITELDNSCLKARRVWGQHHDNTLDLRALLGEALRIFKELDDDYAHQFVQPLGSLKKVVKYGGTGSHSEEEIHEDYS